MISRAKADEQGLGRKDLQRVVDRFHVLGETRLRRIRRTLTHEQRNFFDLLPLLWHINHPMLPGFHASSTPAGVIDFHPDRDQLLLARRFIRGFKEEHRHLRQAPIRGLYLMGSMGSLGQTAGSDMDFWLCHANDLSAADIDLLRQKAGLLEEYASSIGLHAHFFLMNADAFRNGATESLSKESSGHTQHTLLLEEFYRTGLRLAGSPLLWWAVPPDQETHYAAYTERLVHKRFIKADHWLDFGGLHSLPAEEFFGVAHWQLFKGIDAPYKSLLKLMLLEAYAAEYPAVDWLCMETKRIVYSNRDIDPDNLDPYLLILQRITRYLDSRSEADRLQLARRAFYFKTGHQLTHTTVPNDWRHKQMLDQCRKWGWNQPELRLLDTRAEWKLEKVVDERNALVSELSRSYRLLTEFAREQDALAALNTRELALLGRKLYAALDKRPGKVDRVNPGISRDLSEKTLWLRRSNDQPVRWQLFLHPPESMHNTPVKTSISLVEILTWLHLNGICERSTQIHYLPKPAGYGESEQDRILKTLRKYLVRDVAGEHGLDAYADMARGQLSIWFVNVGFNPLAAFADAGYQLISERIDALSFGAAHECLVGSIEHLYTTTWGEVRIERHSETGEGLLDCLCRYLDVFAPHAHKPPPIAAFSYSSTRGGAIAARIEKLTHAVADAFHSLGQETRYLLRIGDRFFQINRLDERYNWLEIGESAELSEHLAQPLVEYLPTRIDQLSLPGSPLPALLTRNQPGQVQVYYWVKDRGIQLYVFDEKGAVFQQWVEDADEYFLIVQQQRFLDTVASRRLLTANTRTPEQPAQFARVNEASGGDWRTTAIRVPRTRVTDHAELVLAVGPGCRLNQGFRLQLGRTEFDSLLLGDQIYREVVQHIQRLRKGRDNYPIYLTGVISAEGDEAGRCPLIDLLRIKQQVEASLAEAMRAR
jgi:adenylate cyclase class 1